MPDLTTTPAAISGPRAFAMAGVTHNDIDVVEVYDSFTYTVLVTLEALGFCKPGEGGAFVSGQRTAPGGDFPMNTNGGGLSYTHPGMYGMFLLIEAVRQLRGECGERQVKDAKLALCQRHRRHALVHRHADPGCRLGSPRSAARRRTMLRTRIHRNAWHRVPGHVRADGHAQQR